MTSLRVERDGHVVVVTIDNPPVNALHRGLYDALSTTFDAFGSERDVRCVVLTGAGNRAFCAGADIKRLDADRAGLVEGSPRDFLDPGGAARRALAAVRDCAVPVVAAVNGPAVGGGVSFVCMCDVIVAADTAWFQLGEVNVGLLGAGRHLQRMVGAYKTRMMYFTAGRVSAREFYRLGAVERVVPAAELLSTALAIAAEIASKSPIGVRLAKQSLNRVEDLPLDVGYRLEQDMTLGLARFDDAAEARAATGERRPAMWRWR